MRRKASALAVPFTVGFNSWARENGLSGADAQPAANPSGDGIINTLKYAFGLDPNTAYGADRYLEAGTGVIGLPLITVTAEPRVRVEFVRRRNAADLVYQVEFASQLDSGWQPAGGAGTVTVIDADWERVVISDVNAPPGSGKRFGRVRVTVD